VAIIAELCSLNRLWRIPVYALPLLLAHSGTGIMVLAACLPILVISQRRWGLLLQGVLLLLVLATFSEYLHLDHLLGRVNEFGQSGTSGFGRFVGGFYLFDQFLWDDPWRTLFGTGAGTLKLFAGRSQYDFADMPLFKMIF